MRNLQGRIEKLEKRLANLADAAPQLHPDCICFLKGQRPMFGFPILQETAFVVKCPVHGDRFEPSVSCYVAQWLREKLYRCSTNPESSFLRWRANPKQYIKAYRASFPPDLFPGHEEIEKLEPTHWKIFLHLLDGTRLQVAEFQFYGRGDIRPDPEIVKSRDAQWILETSCTVARLLSDRGRLIEPSWLREAN